VVHEHIGPWVTLVSIVLLSVLYSFEVILVSIIDWN